MSKPGITQAKTDVPSADVVDGVIAILARQALLDPAELSPSASLEDLGLDSLALVEVIFALEETFDISVPFNPQAADFSDQGFDVSTVSSVIEGVCGLIAAQARA